MKSNETIRFVQFAALFRSSSLEFSKNTGFIWLVTLQNDNLTLFRLGFFGVPGPGGRGGFKSPPPFHKTESIEAIVMKRGG